MELNYEITKQDYLDYNLYYMQYSSTMKKTLLVQRFILPLIFLVFPFILATISSKIPFWYWMTIFNVTTIVWIVFYPRHLKSQVKKRISKMVDEGKNVGFLGNSKLILTEEGITLITEARESKTSWKAVESICETEKHIFIFISAVEAYIVPNRIFESENMKKEFLELLNSKKN